MDLETVRWQKSSYTGNNGGNCVEVAEWRKSSYTGSNGGNCVEVAQSKRLIAVRDSKRPDGPKLFFTPGEWGTFLGGVKDGRFDQV
ncbi:toxin [Sphaerisporangium melleum]|uniref:DUF397 domain-containing protein n=2 Tax=Sphaerisporangium melleum TaxID=321316 RepID=UPI0019522879|nr:DUF397 domain-containing protein [Sphaerisporangium melleum]GII74645.1 toxin [Sphaerisporangium melleum]